MNARASRRDLLKAAGIATAVTPSMHSATGPKLRTEGPRTPKLCITLPIRNPTEAAMRRFKQLGVDHVLSGGPPIPWDETELRSLMAAFHAGGLTLSNLMISGFPKTIYGKPGRDEEIEKVRASIRAAGKVGLPVVEYNFYAHRAMEGYYQSKGRSGSGTLSFDYERMKSLPPLPEVGAHSLDEMWSNVTYFLKAVVPVAQESGVRLALHPNDPPAPLSRGSGQIMATVEGWKRLVSIVPSPHNGITFDCGVTRETGQDPVEVCRYFAKRDCINHVHFRNVVTEIPYRKYTEVFPDEGEVDMFAVMKELVRHKYNRLIYPEHPRGLDADASCGGQYSGWVFNIAYARAMLQAAMSA
jgi:mannonate dehydratase